MKIVKKMSALHNATSLIHTPFAIAYKLRIAGCWLRLHSLPSRAKATETNCVCFCVHGFSGDGSGRSFSQPTSTQPHAYANCSHMKRTNYADIIYIITCLINARCTMNARARVRTPFNAPAGNMMGEIMCCASWMRTFAHELYYARVYGVWGW